MVDEIRSRSSDEVTSGNDVEDMILELSAEILEQPLAILGFM